MARVRPGCTVLSEQLGAVEKRGSPVWRESWPYRLAEKDTAGVVFLLYNPSNH